VSRRRGLSFALLAVLALSSGCASSQTTEVEKLRARAAHERGLAALADRNRGEALVALREAVAFDPTAAAYHDSFGLILLDLGQVEAATAVGLSGTQTMRQVVLPQALKNMIPSLVTQFIVLFKDTSLASIIGFMDLTKAAQVVNNREIRPFELYLFIAVVYWICTYSMSRYARHLEKRLSPA